MKFFEAPAPEKTNKGYPQLDSMPDIYIKRIYKKYEMDSNIHNLTQITQFLKSFFSLSADDFAMKTEKDYLGMQNFIMLYGLVNGNKNTVQTLINNSYNAPRTEKVFNSFEEYVKHMQDIAKKTLEIRIAELEKQICAKNDSIEETPNEEPIQCQLRRANQ